MYGTQNEGLWISLLVTKVTTWGKKNSDIAIKNWEESKKILKSIIFNQQDIKLRIAKACILALKIDHPDLYLTLKKSRHRNS